MNDLQAFGKGRKYPEINVKGLFRARKVCSYSKSLTLQKADNRNGILVCPAVIKRSNARGEFK